jgi:hypothetical protein
MMVDFMKERTASQYTPLNKFLSALIHEAKPKQMDSNDMTVNEIEQ